MNLGEAVKLILVKHLNYFKWSGLNNLRQAVNLIGVRQLQ